MNRFIILILALLAVSTIGFRLRVESQHHHHDDHDEEPLDCEELRDICEEADGDFDDEDLEEACHTCHDMADLFGSLGHPEDDEDDERRVQTKHDDEHCGGSFGEDDDHCPPFELTQDDLHEIEKICGVDFPEFEINHHDSRRIQQAVQHEGCIESIDDVPEEWWGYICHQLGGEFDDEE